MRKIITNSMLILTLALATNAYAKQTLVVWEDIDKAHGIQKAIEVFELENDCKVEIAQMPYVQHIPTMLENEKSGEQLPDIVMLPNDRLGDAATNGYIVPLDFMETEKDKYLTSAVNAFRYHDKVYAVPRSVETMVLYYNQDMLKYPYENFKDYVAFSKEQIKQGKYGVISKWDSFYYAYGFLAANGGYIFKDLGYGKLDPNNIGLNNEGTIKGLTYVKELVNTILPPSVLGDEGWGEVTKLFLEGKAAALISGPWELDGIAKSGLNYGVAPLGRLDNGKYFCPLLGYRAYAITKYSKQYDLAVKFLNTLNRTELALNRYDEIHEIPPLKEVMQMPIILNDDFASTVLTQAQNAHTMPSIPQMSVVWGPIDKAVSAAVTNKVSVKEALDTAVEEIKSAIAENY